jgi:DNA-binding response OmpR family regulator
MFGNNHLKGSKITIIDDEKDLVLTIKELLEGREFNVSFAFDGQKGLEVINLERPDLVLLDINMPCMDGRDVLAKLKKEDTTKDIPVIMLTGRDEQFDRDYGLELGAYDYITKPYDATVLLRQVRKALDKR